MNTKITIYEPDNSIKKGYKGLFLEIYQEMKENSWLTWQFFKRDFFATYKQSLLGIFWVFIIPLFSMATFVMLNRAGLFLIGEINIPYPVYAVTGLAFWQLFSSGLIASSNSLIKAGKMITQINFSRKSLIFASVGQSIVSFIIQFVLLLILLIVYKIMPTLWILSLPLMILPILLLTFGLGLIFSVLNGIMRDIANMMAIIMSFLLFLTPVLYVKPKIGILAKLTLYNPLYYLISVSRDMVLFGDTIYGSGYVLSIMFSIIVFTFCLIIFHLTETRITERI